MPRLIIIFYGLIATALLVSACTPAKTTATAEPTPGITRPGQLTPYVAVSPTPIPTTTQAVPPTTSPSPTPTPRTHIVKQGEDLGGIAYQYHVSVADILAANPTVNPHAMSVGLTLIIPPSKTSASQSGNTDNPPDPANVTPTPMPLESGPITCQRGQDGGVWCFMPVLNNQTMALEGVSANFNVSGPGREPLQVTAYLPLDVLPPGVSLPLVAHLSPQQAAQLALPLQASSQVVSALPGADDGRYMPSQVEAAQIRIAPDGFSASISAKIKFSLENTPPRRVWVAAVASDSHGNIIGVRRWENNSASPLEAGKALDVQFTVYSVAGEIERVELFPETRP